MYLWFLCYYLDTHIGFLISQVRKISQQTGQHALLSQCLTAAKVNKYAALCFVQLLCKILPVLVWFVLSSIALYYEL